ncbi:MAG: AAA family ATPase [Propionibacteriales bacterium]|nr:AAA family ATPase [Propionibacteriales bacterium]
MSLSDEAKTRILGPAAEGAEALQQGSDEKAAKEEAAHPDAWTLEDISDVLAGDYQRTTPTYLTRADGVPLIYAGKMHSLYGESESGKSWVALVAAVEVLACGGRVLFIDFESDRGTVINRLRKLGASPDALRERFGYTRPDVSPEMVPGNFRELVSGNWQLVIIDGVTEALTVLALSGRDEDDVARFKRQLMRPFAEAGAAVVTVDHVTKSKDDRGRFALGSQHKLAALDGAAYVVEPGKAPLLAGTRGEAVLRVAKDREGYVREHSGAYRHGDRTQEAARIVLDETGASVVVSIAIPSNVDAATGEVKPFRPTGAMERASRVIERIPGIGVTALRTELGIRPATVTTALDMLVADDYLGRETIANGSATRTRLTSLKPYREADDPHSDSYVWEPVEGSVTGTAPPSIDGGERAEPATGNTHLARSGNRFGNGRNGLRPAETSGTGESKNGPDVTRERAGTGEGVTPASADLCETCGAERCGHYRPLREPVDISAELADAAEWGDRNDVRA